MGTQPMTSPWMMALWWVRTRTLLPFWTAGRCPVPLPQWARPASARTAAPRLTAPPASAWCPTAPSAPATPLYVLTGFSARGPLGWDGRICLQRGQCQGGEAQIWVSSPEVLSLEPDWEPAEAHCHPWAGLGRAGAQDARSQGGSTAWCTCPGLPRVVLRAVDPGHQVRAAALRGTDCVRGHVPQVPRVHRVAAL